MFLIKPVRFRKIDNTTHYACMPYDAHISKRGKKWFVTIEGFIQNESFVSLPKSKKYAKKLLEDRVKEFLILSSKGEHKLK